jgi:hypothetical protein
LTSANINQVMLKEPTKAMSDFKHGLSIEPTNQGCIVGLERVQQNMFSGQRDEQAISNAMKVARKFLYMHFQAPIKISVIDFEVLILCLC